MRTWRGQWGIFFWLSDEPGQRSKRIYRRTNKAPGVSTIDDLISGILHVLKSGCRWRDCPSVYGPRTTIYNRFNRWSRAPFGSAFCKPLSRPARSRPRHRSTQPISRGAKTQAIGLSRGGQTTKIHVLTDVLGRPAVIRLTPGNVSDIGVADDLI